MSLCHTCAKDCKQPIGVVVRCPGYEATTKPPAK